MRRSIGRAFNAILKPAGYRISRLQKRDITALESALARVVARGMEINAIIDIGASNGQWTQLAHPYFPKSSSLLVEANPVHEASLRTFAKKFPYAAYVLQAAGDTVGEIFFDAHEPFAGVASHTPLPVPTITVPTIDALVEARSLRPPYLIKLDTHGFEVPILKGAQQALKETNLLIVETYNFQINPTSFKFYEICQLLANWGFAPIDFCDPMWRRHDNAFWQFDIFFVRADRKEFAFKGYG
jgi:FkbM family methyltransferase